MKNMNTNEVTTIFHPERCQIKSSMREEKPNNDSLNIFRKTCEVAGM